MPNYFIIDLRSTPPELEILAPEYTTPSQINHISILSNTTLLEYQEIYSIDSLGRRKDYSLNYKEDRYEGDIVFNDILGDIILYARLKDDCLNESALYQKTIKVLKDAVIEIEPSIKSVEISFVEKTSEIHLNILNFKTLSEQKAGSVSTSEQIIAIISEVVEWNIINQATQ